MRLIKDYLKNEFVTVIAFIAAIISMFMTPPGTGYLDYINYSVILLLFCLMAVMTNFKELGAWSAASSLLLTKIKSGKILPLFLILLCFFSSMAVTNDVALITFVPLTLTLYEGKKSETVIRLIILETIAANLGSMATPVGNPQNLHIYSYFKMQPLSFFSAILPVTLFSLIILVTASLLCFRNEKDNTDSVLPAAKPSKKKLLLNAFLFFFCILAVFRMINDIACVILVLAGTLFIHKKSFKKIDYSLLATFICFFIFVGNLSASVNIKNFLEVNIAGNELILSALLSQIISNVPAAVMLSPFSQNNTALLLGVNIGGLGTVIASLASLISFKLYMKSNQPNLKRYLFWFTSYNIFFLMLLFLFINIMK